MHIYDSLADTKNGKGTQESFRKSDLPIYYLEMRTSSYVKPIVADFYFDHKHILIHYDDFPSGQSSKLLSNSERKKNTKIHFQTSVC